MFWLRKLIKVHDLVIRGLVPPAGREREKQGRQTRAVYFRLWKMVVPRAQIGFKNTFLTFIILFTADSLFVSRSQAGIKGRDAHIWTPFRPNCSFAFAFTDQRSSDSVRRDLLPAVYYIWARDYDPDLGTEMSHYSYVHVMILKIHFTDKLNSVHMLRRK